jgi:hypothetical protein
LKIAIISDIHDHLQNLNKALNLLQDADFLICCGDLCSPFVVDALGKNFHKETHIVFGNNDGDLFRITAKAAGYKNIRLHGEFCELTLNGKRFAVNHYDNIGRALAKSEVYNVVCFGHNHQKEISREGNTLIINPGEIMGGLSGESTFAMYDSVKHEAEFVPVK